MSRPRFFADHDLNEHIVDGLLRREPTIEIVRARAVGMDGGPEGEVLAYAAGEADRGFSRCEYDERLHVRGSSGRR